MLGSFFVPCDYLERLAPELMAVPLLDLLSPPAPWLGCSLYSETCDRTSVPHFPGLSRDFDCFDFILEWDGIVG